MLWRLSWNGVYLGKDTSIWPGFQDSYCSNLRLVLCKILILLTNSIFVSEGLFIYIYFLLFEENHQNRISRSEEKILQRFNPIWTGLFANLKDWGAFWPPFRTWLFQVRRRWNMVRVYYGQRSLHIDKNALWRHRHIDFMTSSKWDS